MPEELSLAGARNLALNAHGFGATSARTLEGVLHGLGVLQLDAVNVFARSHYLPPLARIGDYDPEQLDALLWQSGDFTEYWAHEAACIPVADRPLFGWRMREYAQRHHTSGKADTFARHLAWVRDALADRGPQTAGQLEQEPGRVRGPWWDWSATKRAVEMLFATGEVVSVGRERFMRRYALTEHAFPDEAPHPSQVDAQRELVTRAATALGVGTLHDLADYYRMSVTDTKHAVAELEAAGTLTRVHVAGWRDGRGEPMPVWIPSNTTGYEPVRHDALLSPFDPVCWFRPRAERLFGFHYRIEIYTPKAKRQYGYYCLPIMVDGALVGRVDLKADRATGTLMVQAAWQEPKAPEHTADVTLRLLREAAAWQGLEHVSWTGVGNLGLRLLES